MSTSGYTYIAGVAIRHVDVPTTTMHEELYKSSEEALQPWLHGVHGFSAQQSMYVCNSFFILVHTQQMRCLITKAWIALKTSKVDG